MDLQYEYVGSLKLYARPINYLLRYANTYAELNDICTLAKLELLKDEPNRNKLKYYHKRYNKLSQLKFEFD